MKLGMRVASALASVLHGDPAPHTKRGTAAPTFKIYGRRLCLLPYNPRPMSIVAKRLDGSRCHLVGRQASALATCAKFTSRPNLEFSYIGGVVHGTRAVGVSQTLRRSAEGTTYIRQGGHDVGHRPTF